MGVAIVLVAVFFGVPALLSPAGLSFIANLVSINLAAAIFGIGIAIAAVIITVSWLTGGN